MRRLGAVVVLTFLLLCMTATVASAAADGTTGTYSGFTATGTVGTDPIVIRGQIDQPVINGSVVRSINNQVGAKWRPTFAELGDLAPAIMSASNKVILYTDTFNVGRTGNATSTTADDGSYDPNGTTREEKILGMDMLIWKEEYNSNTNKITINDGGTILTTASKSVDNETALEAIYKAVGSVDYSAKWYFRTHESGTGVVPVSRTPFVSKVNSTTGINGAGYYCDVFATRSVPDRIISRAYKEGVITTDATKFVAEAANQRKADTGIDVGDFCIYLKRALDTNGEPIYTEAETTQWLIEYGQTLPTYLTQEQCAAVKYLACRGIVDTGMNFRESLSAQDMLTILMRAKDKDSRLTFKKLDVEYDKTLVSAGFYPVNVDSTVLNMSLPTLTLDNATGTAIPDYFDYYIQKTSDTTFKTSSSNNIDSIIIAENYNDAIDRSSEKELASKADVKYLGLDNGYYHFQVPRIISSNDKSLGQPDSVSEKGYYYFTTTNNSTSPVYVKVPFGGGRYTIDHITDSNPVMRRNAFIESDNANLFDMDRFTTAQSTTLSGKHLAKAYKSIYKFNVGTTDTAKNIRWRGKSLEDARKQFSNEITGFDATSGDVTITITDVDPASIIAKRLTTVSTASGAKLYPSYLSDSQNNVMLVPSTFFKDSTLPNSDKISSIASVGTGLYRILTANSTVYVDTVNKRIISGQCVTELSTSDKSPLIVPLSGQTGEYLIDTRVLPVQINSYLLNDANSTKSLVVSSTGKYSSLPINPIMGDMSCATEFSGFTSNGKTTMLLEGAYTESNFLLYKMRNTTYGDFLVVFMPRGNDTIDTKLNASINALFGVTVGSDDKVVVYNLTTKTSIDNMSLSTTSAITYDKALDMYKYVIPSAQSWNLTSYRKGGVNNTYPLPIVQGKDSNFYDLNFNVVSGYDRIPPSYLSDRAYYALTGAHAALDTGVIFNPTVHSNNKGVDSGSLTLAPTAVGSYIINMTSHKVSDVMKQEGKALPIYYGGMCGTVSDSTTRTDSTLSYTLDINGRQQLKLPETAMLYTFNYDAAYGNSEYVFVRGGVGTTSATKVIAAVPDALKLLETKGFLNLFNWEDFSFIEAIKNADDIMTIIQIVIMAVIPRIMIFDFFALLLLSLVAPYPITQLFCEKVFDPIRILSIGQLDVHTIKTKELAISTFIALVLLGMFTNEALISIFAWLNRGLTGILSQ